MEEKKKNLPNNEVKDEDLDAVTGGGGTQLGYIPTTVDQPQAPAGDDQPGDPFPIEIKPPQ